MNEPKIIQILITPNDATYQNILLGLGDDGVTYLSQPPDAWIAWIPAISKVSNNLHSKRIHALECALREIEIWAKNPELFDDTADALTRISAHALNAIEEPFE